jgi:multidrug efflux pump subunit AcrA (membrane-fusion protein)
MSMQTSPPLDLLGTVPSPAERPVAFPPRKRRWWLWIIFLLIAGVTGGYFAMAGHVKQTATTPTKTKKTGQEPVPVVVDAVTLRKVQRNVQIVGTFHGFDEITVSPKVEGRIKRVQFDIGDKVRPGQMLLEIDDTDYKHAEAEALRSLELELAKLDLDAPPEAKFDVKQLPTVMRAESLRQNAESRFKRLKDSGAGVSKLELEQGETDLRVAQANYQQSLLDARSTLATVRHRQSLLATARQRLADTRVTVETLSPFRLKDLQMLPASAMGKQPEVEFIVAQRMATEGEMAKANPSTPVFRLVMDHPLKMQVMLPERYVGDIKQGQTVAFQVEASPKETFQGWVGRVSLTVNQVSRTFQIDVLIPNPDRRLRAGSFVKGTILTRSEEAPMIPEEALVKFAGVTKVFAIRDNKAVAVPVDTDLMMEVKENDRVRNWVEVKGDLKPGEQVVTSGQTKLVNGSPVKVRETVK